MQNTNLNNSQNYSSPIDPQKLEDFGLSRFQVDFVTHYMGSKNATEAAVRAGSTAKHPAAVASNTMKLKNVQEAVAWSMKNRIEAAGVDSREVISMLKRVYDTAIENGKYGDANKAAELLGSHLGMFRTSQIAESKIKSDAHKTSEELPDIQRDIARIAETLKIKIKTPLI